MTFVPQRVTGTLAAGAHPGSYNGQDAYNDMLIPFVKSRRAQTSDDDETWIADSPNPTLNQFDQGDTRTTTTVVFHPHYSDGARPQPDGKSPAVTALWGTGGNNGLMIAQTTTHDVVGTLQSRSHKGPNHENARDGQLIVQHDPVPTLRSGGDGGIPSSRGEHIIAFSHTQGLDPQPSQHHFPTLRSEGGGQAVAQPIAFTQNQREEVRNLGNVSACLTAEPGSHQQTYIAQPNLAVRRLTPTECERLMGWPDNHTLHRADGKTNSDSARYKQCGNGVATPVAKWIAKHLRNLL